MSQTVENIKSRLDIVDVVGSYIKLERAGSNLKARCPFHNEKTPSFFVSPARGTYHCFGCQRGGDIFSFVEEIEGLPFRDALALLAARAGVEIERIDPKAKSERERLYLALENAARYGEETIGRHPNILSYLEGRGLRTETATRFRVGYIPAGWSNLRDALVSKGFRDEELARAGLVIKGERGKFYDRFRNRILFPVLDAQGKVIGFSGRIFGENDKEGKYINTPETPLYDKSRAIYGYFEAKESIRKTGSCVMVEGQMDVLMAHQAGSTNTVAVSGTALTDEHVKIVHRLADTILFAFDSDGAGKRALLRGAETALKAGLDAKVVPMEAKDPADLIKENKDLWLRVVQESVHVIPFILSRLLKQKKDERETKKKIKELLLPLLARIENKIDQSHFVHRIAEETGIKEQALEDELQKVSREVHSESQKAIEKEVEKAERKRKEIIIEKLLAFYLHHKDESERARWKKEIEEVIGVKTFEEALSALTASRRAELGFEAEIWYNDETKNEGLAEDLLRNYRMELLHEDLRKEMLLLKRAEARQDEKEVEARIKRCQEISKELNNFNI